MNVSVSLSLIQESHFEFLYPEKHTQLILSMPMACQIYIKSVFERLEIYNELLWWAKLWPLGSGDNLDNHSPSLVYARRWNQSADIQDGL